MRNFVLQAATFLIVATAAFSQKPGAFSLGIAFSG